jgi:Lon protease-like protein
MGSGRRKPRSLPSSSSQTVAESGERGQNEQPLRKRVKESVRGNQPLSTPRTQRIRATSQTREDAAAERRPDKFRRELLRLRAVLGGLTSDLTSVERAALYELIEAIANLLGEEPNTARP